MLELQVGLTTLFATTDLRLACMVKEVFQCSTWQRSSCIEGMDPWTEHHRSAILKIEVL